MYFQLQASALRTEGTEFGLLPTVQTQGLKVCIDGKTEFLPVGLLPTPNAADVNKNRGSTECAHRSWSRPNAQKQLATLAKIGLLPTPRSNKVNDMDLNNPKMAVRNRGNLEESVAKMVVGIGKDSRLNPRFVAEMMGFPPDWTERPFLNQGTDASPSKPTETPSSPK